MRYYYDNGTPFSNALIIAIDKQLERIENKRASLILIDGPVGTGKTTLAVHIADYINQKRGLNPIHLAIKDHTQLSLGGKEFAGNFRECHKKRLPVIIYDEAGDFSKRGSITKFNMMINRIFETYRGFKIIVIICLPFFAVLDNQLFDNQIPRMLINLKSRAHKCVNFRVYSLSQMNWLRYWFEKLPRGAKHKVYSKAEPNFYGRFLNLPPQREEQLDKLSTFGKKNLLKIIDIDMRGLYHYQQLAEACHRSSKWVRDIVNELKIKPVTVIDGKYYFDKSVLSVLMSKVGSSKREGDINSL